MRNLFIPVALVATSLCNFPAYAEMQQPTMNVMTIEQVQGLGDNSPVMLEGMITQSMGDEKYTFQDSTGATITVEIDDDNWNGLKPGPQDMVIITGETDKKGNIIEIDVENIVMKQ